MAPERAAYRPRDAERGVLYTVVRAHLETFLHEAARRATRRRRRKASALAEGR